MYMLYILLRKLYGIALLFLRFFKPNSTLPPSSLTTSLLLHLLLIINIIPTPNISMYTIISSVRLSKKVKFNSYIVPLWIWLLIYLWRHFHLPKSSTLQVHLVLVQLEGKYRKIQAHIELLYYATTSCACFVLSCTVLSNCSYFIYVLFSS